MAEDTLRVVARIVAKPDKIEEVRAILTALVEPTRKEKGCRGYELLQNKADPAEFTFVEEWDDEAALDAHVATAHFKEAAGRFAALLAEALDARLYRVVA